MKQPPPFCKLAVSLLTAATLSGCASLSPDNGSADISALMVGRTAGLSTSTPNAPTVELGLAPATSATNRKAVAKLLEQALTVEDAVRIALLNNPAVHEAMAALGISDAERVQAATLPNPHFSLGRFKERSKLEFERALGFNVVGLVALPWRAKWQNQQHEIAKLQAAQTIITIAAQTCRAWINAVAAQQSAQYMADAKAAAEASGELARRMARVGNWSRLDQAREQVLLADATTLLAKSQQTAFSEREQLIRLMGLWGAQTGFTLPTRLPDLPKAPQDLPHVEERALSERLDVRSRLAESAGLAESLGLVKVSGFVSALDARYQRSTTLDRSSGDKDIKRGWELELPIPLFDWGGAANARAQNTYMQSVARASQTAIQARSEAREAYHGYRTSYDVAVHYRDEVVPLRKFINNEILLRYNGMLASVFDLLGDTRAQIMAVNSAIEAQRDFWLADAALQTTLTGTSPGSLASTKSGAATTRDATAGH